MRCPSTAVENGLSKRSSAPELRTWLTRRWLCSHAVTMMTMNGLYPVAPCRKAWIVAQSSDHALRFANRQIGGPPLDRLGERVECRHSFDSPEAEIVQRGACRGSVGGDRIEDHRFGTIVG